MIQARDGGPEVSPRYFVIITNDRDTYFYGFKEDGSSFRFLGTKSDGAHDSDYYGELIDPETLPKRILAKALELESE